MKPYYKISTMLMIFLLSASVFAQAKIKLKRSNPGQGSGTDLSTEIERKPTTAEKAAALGKKDKWLAVGLSLSVPGAGHFYIGKYSSGAIALVGSYGLMFGGIAAMLTAHSTKDIIVDGNFIREEDDTNKPLFMLGSIFLASGIIFYLGSVIDIFIDVSEHNRRVDRLRRYNRKRSKLQTGIYMAHAHDTYYVGQRYRF